MVGWRPPSDVLDGHGPYVDMLCAAAFLAVIWSLGRVMRLVELPASIGALVAGILLGPELLDIVPYATRACSHTAASLSSMQQDDSAPMNSSMVVADEDADANAELFGPFTKRA